MEEFFKYMRIFSKRSRMLIRGASGVLSGEDPFTGSDKDKKLLTEFIKINNRSNELSDVRTIDHDGFNSFVVEMRPKVGYYTGGTFQFLFKIPENYKQQPPIVRCLTRLWHPNITEDGQIRAAILESHPEENWGEHRDLCDVITCLEKMLVDVMPSSNPLNQEASDMLLIRTRMFRLKAALFVWTFAR